MSVATGGTSGTYYAVGGALAAAVTKGGKIQCTAETCNASVANANLIATKGIEIAFVQNDITYW
ncbi:TAXI family TRAP transporter solute-binding subunit, partial [Cloacibacillus evryensis]|uniref:TAXI family TRAP transporter solute-binding subunit n=1 Tax=Cloacibacillus evryensis TaxID=508460 RepID=UPI002730AD6A